MQRLSAIATLLVLGLGSVHAGDDGFKPMFNGKDLTGWHNVNGAANTWFVKDNMIITTGKPTGYLRTDKQYENFIAEFEWYHAPTPKGSVGNSGFFVWCDPLPAVGTGYTRGIEVQVLVNLTYKSKKGEITASSHGDLFSIHGATCKPDRPHPTGAARCMPSENNCKGEYEWNHYKVVANHGVLKLTVNGKEVSGVYECNPRKGYIALEAEGSECRFKNLKIKELPSTNPKPNEICDLDKGFASLFTGLDLTGWAASEEQKKAWIMKDGIVTFDGKENKHIYLWSGKEYRDFEVTCDWRFPKADCKARIALRAIEKCEVNLESDKKIGDWNRTVVRLKGDRITVHTNGKLVVADKHVPETPKSGAFGLMAITTAQFRNVFVRELTKGD